MDEEAYKALLDSVIADLVYVPEEETPDPEQGPSLQIRLKTVYEGESRHLYMQGIDFGWFETPEEALMVTREAHLRMLDDVAAHRKLLLETKKPG